jgi:hypothetical protein
MEGLANTTFFVGGGGEAQNIEAACADLGAIMAGFRDMFTFGGLKLGDGGGAWIGNAHLVDNWDNAGDGHGNDAVYAYNLELDGTSTLDLDGYNLYYLNGTIDGGATILNGTLTQVVPVTGNAVVERVPTGHNVDPVDNAGTGAGIGTYGMIGHDDGDARVFSMTFTLPESQVDGAVDANAEGYLTLKMFYDAAELAVLGLAEENVRPYWYDDFLGEWVLGGTATDGSMGESLWAGFDTDPTGFGLGYAGLNTIDDYVWVNITHASDYGIGGFIEGVIPEPSTLAVLASAILLFVPRRRTGA